MQTWLQCQRKIKHLKVAYHKAKDNNNKNGQSSTTCLFFEELDEILYNRPTLQPTLTLHSAEPATDSDTNSISNNKGE